MSLLKNIVQVTTVHPRYDVRILHKECATLKATGYNVTLIVADSLGNERVGAVPLIDIGGNTGSSRIIRLLTRPRRALAAILALEPDVVHVHDPELLTIAGPLLRRGIKFVYDSHEDVPRQIMTKYWIPSSLRRLVAFFWEIYEDHIARKLSGIISATPLITARFSRQNALSINVNNFPLLSEFEYSDIDAAGADCRNICYIGGINEVRGIREIIQALPQVPDCRLILCGPIAPESFGHELRALPGWGQVDYRGSVDRAGVRAAMSESRCGMVTLLPMVNFLDSLPVKMFEYMAASLPIIASDFPLWRGIVEDAGCGYCVDPTSIADIASAIKRVLDDPSSAELGKAGRRAVESTYNWGQESTKLLKFYEELAQ